MKKTVLIMAIALLTTMAANAQVKFGFSLNTAMPSGDFSDYSGFGLGASVNGKYMLSDNMATGLQVGYIHFGEKDNSGSKLSIVPITLTWAYYFTKEGLKPYIGADLGMYHLRNKVSYVDIDDDDNEIEISETVSSTKFGVAPTFGIEYGLSEKVSFDGNLKYNTISTEGSSTSYFGINIGLSFKL